MAKSLGKVRRDSQAGWSTSEGGIILSADEIIITSESREIIFIPFFHVKKRFLLKRESTIQDMLDHSVDLQQRLSCRTKEAELKMIKTEIKDGSDLARPLASLCVLETKLNESEKEDLEKLGTEIRNKMKRVGGFKVLPS